MLQLARAGAVSAGTIRNEWATPRVSAQRPAGTSDPNDNAHQGERERHSGLTTGASGDAHGALRGHCARGSYRGR